MLKECFALIGSVGERCHPFLRFLRGSMEGSAWVGHGDLSMVNDCPVGIMSVAFALTALEDYIRVFRRDSERDSY